ncbi:hypothetical protein BJ322DRAFT_1133279 [Thelephora terrestris]|uniref:FK506-binding protein n=1 Tax=Thelephora terrestris TaxID=56493 RepID=A0A9P6HR20_9AGAM|nr:hypothetical protein BJ322DRAFT_1133279 [Thelephora terrestris]
MHTAVAVWSLVVNPGTKETVIPPSDIQIHVKGLSLGAELKDKDGRSSLKLSYEFVSPPDDDDDDDDEEKEDDGEARLVTREVILGSLTPGKIEQASVDIVLDDEDEYIFEVVGKNPVHIYGNYIRDSNRSWGDDEDDSDEEEAFHLGDVSSDVEVDPAELGGIDSDDVAMEEDSARFEEIAEEPKGKKRLAEKIDDGEKAATKAEKKAAKKQKGENGVAIPKEDSMKETKEEKKEGKKEKKKDKEEKKKEGKAAGEVKALAGGVQVKDIKVGSGPGAQKGQSIKMRYIGKLTDGKIFDSNTKGKPFVFRLGAGEVIKGWDVGVVGMKAGGERELTIPAPMAYGKRKTGDIPPNSTLKFEVKLLSIE